MFWKTILVILLSWTIGCFLLGWALPQPDLMEPSKARTLTFCFSIITIVWIYINRK